MMELGFLITCLLMVSSLATGIYLARNRKSNSIFSGTLTLVCLVTLGIFFFYILPKNFTKSSDTHKVIYKDSSIASEKLEFEDHNFKVPTIGWTEKVDEYSGIHYLEAPTKDMWAYLKCDAVPDELVGEQLFTWDAAIREAERVGARVPTDEEFERLLKTKEDMPNLLFAGFRGTNGSFGYLGAFDNFWSSLESGSSAWFWSLYSGYATVNRDPDSKAYGFSLRCLKD